MNSVLVNCQWLAEHLHDTNLVLLDASMAKVIGKSPLLYDTLQVIPTSLKCNLETDFCDTHSDSVHAFPSELQFEMAINKLGINQDSVVVLYDNQGIYSAPRAWWIFKTMGFEQVYILNGGLPQWIAEQRATVNEYQLVKQNAVRPFKANYKAKDVCSAEFVLKTIPDSSKVVLDARANGRFKGLEKEPRAGIKSGHIPNAINMPFALVLNELQFKSKDDLTALFLQHLPQDSEQLIFSCGSGITACIILVAAIIADYDNLTLYDGSWAEWGSGDYPIAS